MERGGHMKKIFSEGERKVLSLLLLCTFILFIWLLIEPPHTESIASKEFGYSLFSHESIETADKIGNFKLAVREFFLKVKEILKR